jgi:DHA2 family multidrug resistance protein
MTSAPAVAAGSDELLNRRMITASVMMATIVVILDMTIATIALPHMQGGLGATQDQVSWVMTTYFMMQAITMSATGWLAGRLGRKRLFIGALAGFAVFSILSGNATSIEEILSFPRTPGDVFGADRADQPGADARFISRANATPRRWRSGAPG